MEFLRLPPDEDAVGRYVEELWLPYHHELETIVDTYELADDIDIVDAETEFRVDRIDSESYQIVVAVEPVGETVTDPEFAAFGGDLVGFIAMETVEAPPVFDQPDRLRIGDLYVQEEYRGDGVAEDLVEQAVDRAREEGCSELTLDVDVGNERAVGFYEKVGFETVQRQMTVSTNEVFGE